MVKENPTKAMKIVIPRNANQSEEKKELLKNLQSISQEDIEKIGSEVYLEHVKNSLANDDYVDLNKEVIMSLINSNDAKLFLDNIDKVRWLIDCDVANVLIMKGLFKPWMLKHFPKKDRKNLVLKSIRNHKNKKQHADFLNSLNLWKCFSYLTDCDLKFARDLIEAGCPTKVIISYLHSFNENDRTSIALLAVELWIDFIPFKSIPKKHLNLEFAKDLKNIGFDINKIGRNLCEFPDKDRKDIALMVLEAGGTVALHSLCERDRDLDFAKKLIAYGYEIGMIGLGLHYFIDKDRKAIALVALKSGEKIDLDSLSAEDKDDELANAMIDAGFKDKVKQNKQKFKWLKLRTRMRLW